jgi:hypothetical protein
MSVVCGRSSNLGLEDVPPGDFNSITARCRAEALRPYLEDPVLALETGRRGRQRVEQHFTFERTVAGVAAV